MLLHGRAANFLNTPRISERCRFYPDVAPVPQPDTVKAGAGAAAAGGCGGGGDHKGGAPAPIHPGAALRPVTA